MTRLTMKFVTAAVLSATALTAITPAEARSRHHHHRDRVDGGDILAGIVLIGAIAAIAGSGKKERDRRAEDARLDPPYRGADGQDRDFGAAPDAAPNGQWVPGGDSAEVRAVDACSWAAEGDTGEEARVGQIDGVARDGDGWRVTGSVAAPEMMPRDFVCTYRSGRVTDVSFR